MESLFRQEISLQMLINQRNSVRSGRTKQFKRIVKGPYYRNQKIMGCCFPEYQITLIRHRLMVHVYGWRRPLRLTLSSIGAVPLNDPAICGTAMYCICRYSRVPYFTAGIVPSALVQAVSIPWHNSSGVEKVLWSQVRQWQFTVFSNKTISTLSADKSGQCLIVW